jgi:hypothetical protein
MKQTKITIIVKDNLTSKTRTHVLTARESLSDIYMDFDRVSDAVCGDILERLKPDILKAANRDLGRSGRNENGKVVWRLEFHDDGEMHWNANDEHKPNTNGWRTVITCTSKEFDAMDEKATIIYKRLMRENGRVDYVEFYKAMNE